MLTSSSDSSNVLNEHADVDQYGSFGMPSEMPYKNYPESLMNKNEIPIELSC